MSNAIRNSHLTPGGKLCIHGALANELKTWKSSQEWWAAFQPEKPEEACNQMSRWHGLFMDFCEDIQADAVIEEVFTTWVNRHHGTDFKTGEEIPVGAMNVPQFRFHEAYKMALSLLAESLAENGSLTKL